MRIEIKTGADDDNTRIVYVMEVGGRVFISASRIAQGGERLKDWPLPGMSYEHARQLAKAILAATE